MAGARAKKNGYEDWETPEQIAKIEAWAAEGLTKAEIAHNMGISRSAFVNWRSKSSDIENAIKRGEDSAIDKVENALFSAACSGNITAQIFFLKNKRPQDWKDKRENEISGNGEMRLSWRSSAKNEEKKND